MAHTYNPSIWEVRQENPLSQQWPRIQRQDEGLGLGYSKSATLVICRYSNIQICTKLLQIRGGTGTGYSKSTMSKYLETRGDSGLGFSQVSSISWIVRCFLRKQTESGLLES